MAKIKKEKQDGFLKEILDEIGSSIIFEVSGTLLCLYKNDNFLDFKHLMKSLILLKLTGALVKIMG